jgi:hypothetical protein
LCHFGARWIVAGPADRTWRGGWVLAANVALLAAFKYLVALRKRNPATTLGSIRCSWCRIDPAAGESRFTSSR